MGRASGRAARKEIEGSARERARAHSVACASAAAGAASMTNRCQLPRWSHFACTPSPCTVSRFPVWALKETASPSHTRPPSPSADSSTRRCHLPRWSHLACTVSPWMLGRSALGGDPPRRSITGGRPCRPRSPHETLHEHQPEYGRTGPGVGPPCLSMLSPSLGLHLCSQIAGRFHSSSHRFEGRFVGNTTSGLPGPALPTHCSAWHPIEQTPRTQPTWTVKCMPVWPFK